LQTPNSDFVTALQHDNMFLHLCHRSLNNTNIKSNIVSQAQTSAWRPQVHYCQATGVCSYGNKNTISQQSTDIMLQHSKADFS